MVYCKSNFGLSVFKSMLPSLEIRFGISRDGRLLIADEMGVGKSIQALAVAQYYSQEWPLLIVCPASVKAVWKNVCIHNFIPLLIKFGYCSKLKDFFRQSRMYM